MMNQSPGWGELIRIRPRPDTFQLSRGRTVFISGHDGEADEKQALQGLYVYDARVLSRYCWRMNGKQPEFSCGSNVDQANWLGYYVQAPENCKDTPTGECDPLQQTIELRLARSVGEGMHEDVHLTNHTQIATTVNLELLFQLPFVSLDEAEQGRQQHGKLELHRSQPEPNVWEQMADYRAQHKYSHQGNEGVAELHRGLRLRIENAASPPEIAEDRIAFRAQLPPHGEWHACLSWLGYVEGQLLPLSPVCPLVTSSSDWDQRRARFFALTASFSTPQANDLSATVDRVLYQSRRDLGDLRLYDLDSPHGIALAAGVPTYVAVFGRDMQAASWQATVLSPDLLRGSLNVFNKIPAKEQNDWRDAQPGRIPHEIHTGPLSVLNFRPQGLYYGDVTSSFLFPTMVCELWHWTGDLDSVRSYVDTAMGTIKWADTYSLDSSTGFYRYQSHSEQGEKNQGWKDSDDAIVYPDGSQVEAPIGTCEMQAFVYAAKLHFSEIMFRLGHVNAARRLYGEAEDLKARFNEKFWMEDEGYYALGIDPDGNLIRSVAGDPGHCLLSGIVDESRIKRVAARMMRDDLFSGWGLRTLSADHPAFNPFSYHRGSVWPVTNAGFVLAFGRYGLHGEMHRLARAVFELAALFDHHRLPELVAGHQRTLAQPFPGLYTRADWPQAWSASAPFAMLQAIVGIYPYAPAHLLFLDPHLPEWLPEIKIERLRIGNASVSQQFSRADDGSTKYNIIDLEGTLHIVHQPSPWSLTTGWAERIHDAVSSFIPHRKVG